MSNVNETMRFIEVSTGKYPLTFDMIRDQLKNTVSFNLSPPLEDVNGFGFEIVIDTPIPTGDIVTEAPPALIDGVWQRAWLSRSYAEDEIAQQLQAAKDHLNTQITLLREKDLAYGLVYTFADGTTGGVQMRPADRTNLIGIRLEAYSYIEANVTDVTIDFRSLENVTRQLSPQEVVALTNAATVHTKQIYAVSWSFKDKVTDATTVAELPVIPATFVNVV